MGKPENIDKVIASFRDAVIQGQKGWRGGYVLIDRQTGKLLTMTLWESREAMEESASLARQIWGEAASKAGAAQPTVEAYEVAMQPEPAQRESEAGSPDGGHARVSTITGKPENIDRLIDFFKRSMTGKEKGWQGAYALVNRATGKVLTMTLWESRKAIEETAPAANRIRGEAVSIAGAGEPTVELYEVALQPEPAELGGKAR